MKNLPPSIQQPSSGTLIPTPLRNYFSSDEAALVQAASDLGFTSWETTEILSIRTPRSADVKKHGLLEIPEFTSARNRMSTVLRRINYGFGQGSITPAHQGRR